MNEHIYDTQTLTSIVAKMRQDKRIVDNDTQLSELINISLITLYKRLLDKNWKVKEIQRINEIIEQNPHLVESFKK